MLLEMSTYEIKCQYFLTPNTSLPEHLFHLSTEREKEEQEEEMEGREQKIRTLTDDLVGKHDKVSRGTQSTKKSQP